MCHKIDNCNIASAYFLDFFGITFDLLKEVSPQPSADEGAVAGLCASRCIVLKPHKGQLHSPWIHPATHKTQQWGAFYSHPVQFLSSLSVRKGVFRCDNISQNQLQECLLWKLGPTLPQKTSQEFKTALTSQYQTLFLVFLSTCISVVFSFFSLSFCPFVF